jgi:hypothetical protein
VSTAFQRKVHFHHVAAARGWSNVVNGDNRMISSNAISGGSRLINGGGGGGGGAPDLLRVTVLLALEPAHLGDDANADIYTHDAHTPAGGVASPSPSNSNAAFPEWARRLYAHLLPLCGAPPALTPRFEEQRPLSMRTGMP